MIADGIASSRHHHVERVEHVTITATETGDRQASEAIRKAVQRAGSAGLQEHRAAPPMRLRKVPGPFPRARGKRISGQMARFTVFQKKKPGQLCANRAAHIPQLRDWR